MRAFEGAHDRREALRAPGRIFLQAGFENRHEGLGDVRLELPPDRLPQEAPVLRSEPAGPRLAFAGPEGQRPVGEHAEGVDVRSRVDGLAAQELRRAVPDVRVRPGIRESADGDGVVRADRDRARVEVSVDRSPAVRELQGPRDPGEPAQGGPERQFVPAPEARDQRFAARGLLDSTGCRAVDPEVEDPGDRVVFQALGRGGALQEEGLGLRRLTGPGIDDDGSVVPRVATEVGGCAGPCFQAAEDLEATDTLTHARMPRS